MKVKWFVLLGMLMMSGMGFGRSPEESLQTVRSNMFKLLPSAFEARLTGKVIEAKLKTIPADYVLKGKEAFVQLSYHKKRGIRIVVQNVDELYSDLFQQYVRFFTLGPILTTEEFSSITNRYQIDYVFPSNFSVLGLTVRNSENMFRLYLDKNRKGFVRVDYLVGKKILSSTVIVSQSFKKFGKIYSIPVKFLTKTGGTTDRLPSLFKLDRIQILKK